MRPLIAVIAIVAVAGAAPAQNRVAAAHLASSPNIGQSADYGLHWDRSDVADSKVSCLIRKNSGREECRTFAEWRKVAAAIDAVNARER